MKEKDRANNPFSMDDLLNKYPPDKAVSAGREPPPPRGNSQSPYLDHLIKVEPQYTIDLHGMTGEEAETLIVRELRASYKKGRRKIRIIHGRGLHSENGPVLPEIVKKVLSGLDFVIKYGKEPRNKGGEGATWVILRNK